MSPPPSHSHGATPHPRDPARDEVAALCRAEATRWNPELHRNLVLFFDGTGNVLGNRDATNVVKLWRAVEKSDQQIVYYDSGVGTAGELPPDNAFGWLQQQGRRLAGLALAGGVHDNIVDGYRFLVETYREGDRIFLLGFSRGAFTARAIAGMVNMFGLIYPSGLTMLPGMVRAYFASPRGRPAQADARDDFRADVRAHLARGRAPLVHFVGVWDTVETVGSVTGLAISNAPTMDRKRFVHVRHALALHETRAQYKPRLYVDPQLTPDEQTCRSFDQRWFRGAHGDVGGGYEEDGLSDLALDWMRREAADPRIGLRFQQQTPHAPRPDQAVHDPVQASPLWALTGQDTRQRPPDARLDDSAQPLAGATPCCRPRTRTATWAGWLLAVLALLGAVCCWRCVQGACSGTGRALADGLFMLGAGLAAAWPLAWGVRRMVPAALARNQRLPRPVRLAHVPVLGMVLVGAAQLSVAAWPAIAVLAPLVASAIAGLWIYMLHEDRGGLDTARRSIPATTLFAPWIMGGLVALGLWLAWLHGQPVLAATARALLLGSHVFKLLGLAALVVTLGYALTARRAAP